MFSEILNYFVIPTMVSLGAFGVFYILNPDTANKVIKNVAWESVKMYSKASIYLENLAQTSSTDEDFIDDDNDDFDEIKPLLSYYDFDDSLEVQLGSDYETLPQKWWVDIEENVDLIILKNENPTELFKTFKNYNKFTSSDNNWDKVEKQFVQIELVQNDKCIDIHKYLNSFYINGNILFTPAFLKWYLQKWFNNVLTEDTYTLKIFDKDVNLFNITPEQYIILTDNGYKIKNIDDESESDDPGNDEESTSEYEGAQDD